MFGRHYYGGRYFGPQYFGDGGTGAPPAPPDSAWGVSLESDKDHWSLSLEEPGDWSVSRE
jgi:hypothetical protein